MHVLALTPRGYCHGVVDAIRTLRDIAHDQSIPRPIHVLGMIVHNKKIVDDFEALDIHTLDDTKQTRLDLLDAIDSGTVVFTAHGVSDRVFEKAKAKNLTIIDTTCKDVKHSQDIIKAHLAQGFHVVFIGKHHHPESETVSSYHDTNVHVVQHSDDVEALDLGDAPIAITNQTTMSLFDIYHLAEAVQHKFAQAYLIEELCDATKTRQLAVKQQPSSIDMCFVVGDTRSNNSKKLVEVSNNNGVKAKLIQSVEDLDIEELKNYTSVSVTSGASTPSQVTKEVVTFLKAFNKDDETTHDATSKLKNLFAQR